MADEIRQIIVIEADPSKLNAGLKTLESNFGGTVNRMQLAAAASSGKISGSFAQAFGAIGVKHSMSDQAETLPWAFEEVFRRCDFENHRVMASATYEVNVPRAKLNPTLIAIAFGNFLATKGITLSDKILGSDH